jgi:tRNA pseudouridine32 synthase/23S rRNA pseudouridine746 synthase
VLSVLFRNDDFLALDKPSGVALFADRTGDANLWDELKEQLAHEQLTPRSVHRLDKGTSGILLVALTRDAQRELNRAFNPGSIRGSIRKFYVARVMGGLDLAGTGTIDLPLRKGRKSRYRVAGLREAIHRENDTWRLCGVAEPGYESHTRVRRLRSMGADTLLALAPKTGRTHQLRVHLSWIGHPIRGDQLYGRPDTDAQRWPRLALHCHRMVFEVAHTRYSIVAPLPESFTHASD